MIFIYNIYRVVFWTTEDDVPSLFQREAFAISWFQTMLTVEELTEGMKMKMT